MNDAIPASAQDEAAKAAYRDYKRGDLAAARAACLRLLEADPAHVGSLFVLGLVEMKAKKLEDAIAALGRLAEVRPSAETYSNLTNCQYALGQLEAALGSIRTALELDPDMPGARTTLATILHGLERYDEALAAALDGERIAPDNEVAVARVASVLERLGRFDEAQERFRKARELGAPTKPYAVLAFDRKLFEYLAAMRRGRPQPEPYRGPRDPQRARLVALTCCDAEHFAQHGRTFVEAFARNAGEGDLLHVHVVDPDPGLEPALERIGREVPAVQFAVSTESSPYERKNLIPPAYYSCSRFLNLPFFLDRYKAPVIGLDADATLEQPFKSFVDSAAGSDIGLFRRGAPYCPWLDIPAGIVVANPTPGARRYFELAGNYMLNFLVRGEAKRYLEQAALYCVLRMLERFGGARDARLLPPRLNANVSLDAMFRLPTAPSVSWISQPLRDSRTLRYSPADGESQETD